jgi:hypothetical protein
MGSAIVVNDGFTEIDAGAVFSAEIEPAFVAMLVDSFVIHRFYADRIVIAENLEDAFFEEIVVRLDVVTHETLWIISKISVDDFPDVCVFHYRYSISFLDIIQRELNNIITVLIVVTPNIVEISSRKTSTT